jgi:sulfite reductase beta subunit-like hemoprotein
MAITGTPGPTTARKPDIPAAKRAGLPVDLARLAAEGDGWLTPEDRYALKTHGVCTQLQAGVFMVRVRVPGGVLPTSQARALARIARRYGPDWLHLTTRQNVELHWVEGERVEGLLAELDHAGLSTRSTCGHTLRNVVCSEDAGVGLDEPFDCFPDAHAVSAAIVARSAELNVVLPSRINASFGGSARCRADALINDLGFVSCVRDGEAGYEVWAGGSLGKSPVLSVQLDGFVLRADVLAAAEALVEVFVAHGDLDSPVRGRLKFVLAELGEDGFRAAWQAAFAEARRRPHPDPAPVEQLAPADHRAVLAVRPEGGWSPGVRPQRTPGLALVTVEVPLGDTNGSELELLADLADRLGDGALVLTRDQDVTLRNVPVGAVPAIREAVGVRALSLLGEGRAPAVRACTGSAVCAIGITNAPEAGRTLLSAPRLAGRSGLRVHVSGCPNSCAQHQAADIGLSGAKVRIGGATTDGYQVWLGADLAAGQVGEVVGRVAAADLPAAVDAVAGVWEALRREGETLGATVARLGPDALAAQVAAELPARWEPGPELEPWIDQEPVPMPATRR